MGSVRVEHAGGESEPGGTLASRLKAASPFSGSQISKVRPAYQQVAEQLRSLILEGALTPGDRFPPEFELAEIFGVSRSTVREALRVLASQNLIRTTRGTAGGTFVARADLSHVSEYLETSLGLMSDSNEVSLANLLESRELLEVPAAGLAAVRREQSHLDEMLVMLEREKRAVRRGSRFRENRNFHGVVVEASGNRLLGVMTEPVFRVLQARLRNDGVVEPFWENVHDDHLEIHDRIAAGDEAGAAEAMRDHLNKLEAAYLDGDEIGP